MKRIKKLFRKTVFCFLFYCTIGLLTVAQDPQYFNYQVVIRGGDGTLVCIETFTPTTNAFGLVTLYLGRVNPVDFSAIDWSSKTYSLKTELVPDGGINYINMGTIPLLTVSFSMYAKTSENVFSGNYDDLKGKPDLSHYLTSEVDGDTTNEIELPTNVSTWDMCYYDGSKWSKIDKPTNPDFRYSLKWDVNNDKPFWKTQLPLVVFNGQTFYVYLTDNCTDIFWYNCNYILTNDNSTTDGEVNTVLIVTRQGEGSYAAKLCADLVAYGYDDWYLPSKDELNALYQNKNEMKRFSDTYYWNSTEYNDTGA